MSHCRSIWYLAALLLYTGACAQSYTGSARTQEVTRRPAHEMPAYDKLPQADAIISRFEARFAAMDSLVFAPASDTTGVTLLSDADSFDFVTGERVDAIDRVVDAEIAAMKRKNGLDIRGQTYVRPGRSIGYDPDDPLVAYNAKVQAELEWNFFHSSLYKRASKIKELRLKGELRQLEFEKDAIGETVILQKHTARNRYYGQLLSVLNVHAANLKLLMETQVYLLQHGKISSDDLLKLISEQAEVDRQLVAIRSDSVIVELPTLPRASIIAVRDTATLMNYIRNEYYDLRKFSLRRELLEAQRKNIDYLQTMDIQPFARYSWYNRENTHNTYNIDVGISFKIPLSSETAKKRRALRAEQAVVDYEEAHFGGEVEHEVILVLRELENYNENIRGEFERMNALKAYLQRRIDSYAHVAGEYSRVDRLQEYNAYLQAWERMLAYTYQRDCRLIDLQSYVTDAPISDHLAFYELN